MTHEQEYAWIVKTRLELDAMVNQGDATRLHTVFQQCNLTIEDELTHLNLSTKSLQFLFAYFVGHAKKTCPSDADESRIQNVAKLDASYFLLDLATFITASEEIISMVVAAAIKRKMKDIPALREQNTLEQIDHLWDHLALWRAGDIGDEATVEDQAKHATCRALLAYFTMKSTEIGL